MKAHILQHVPFEDIGSMTSWFEARGAETTYTRFFEDAKLPALDGIDLVVAMGGPMSVNDESSFPWLLAEKQFIRYVVNNGVPVVGVCLGAQLIASALGARVYRSPHKEIGWFPIEAAPGGPSVFRFPDVSTVFHWHGETFDLPHGAVRLARSAACENQAFQIGRHVIGLQFHLETTRESVQALLENCSDELVQGPYVQTVTAIRHVAPKTYPAINHLMSQVLSYLTRTSGQKCSR